MQWLVYILSFLIPPFGFITFWAFSWKPEEELKCIAKGSLVASFIGVVVWLILTAVGITLGFLGMGMGLIT